MKKNIIGVSFLLFLFSLVSGLCAFDFSADAVISMYPYQGKTFVSGGKMRMETPQMLIISRMDKKVTWMLMPSQKMYAEVPINPNMVVTDKFHDEIDRKLIGQDTVDGKPTDKYLVTVKNNGVTEKIHQWICKSTGIPLKMAAADDSWFLEFKNLKIGSQDASLFELPSGFNKMSMQMPK